MMLRILSLIAAASLLVACGGGSEQTVDYSARKKGRSITAIRRMNRPACPCMRRWWCSFPSRQHWPIRT